MWEIKKCDIKDLMNEDGSLRIPSKNDWKNTGEIFVNRDEAEWRRIELYKRGDGYYRIENIKYSE